MTPSHVTRATTGRHGGDGGRNIRCSTPPLQRSARWGQFEAISQLGLRNHRPPHTPRPGRPSWSPPSTGEKTCPQCLICNNEPPRMPWWQDCWNRMASSGCLGETSGFPAERGMHTISRRRPPVQNCWFNHPTDSRTPQGHCWPA